jgi:predicted O-methyltransferase YrrM
VKTIRRWFVKQDENRAVQAACVMRAEIRDLALGAKGFLAEQEGLKLFELARESSQNAPCLEIGSYCGKSALYLAEGCRAAGRFSVYSVDHHRGSVEQQPGQQYFDPELFDASRNAVNTLPRFLATVSQASLQDWVIPIVGESGRVAANWSAPLSLVFIDGAHSEDDVRTDYESWSGHIMPGGYLCFHDVFLKPEEGGQAPRQYFERAAGSPAWRTEGVFKTLGVLRRRR